MGVGIRVMGWMYMGIFVGGFGMSFFFCYFWASCSVEDIPPKVVVCFLSLFVSHLSGCWERAECLI